MSSGEAMAKILVDSALHPVAVEGVGGAGELVAQLRDYRRQLVGVATNLNQIARHANTVSEIPSGFDAVVAKVLRLHDDIDDILAGVRR
ncbi:plasmid mobilization relaxosome protein MobC [Actinomyces howellii]|uniref:plasmid mobilization relaxosome protein MobC n=1 Tax=Actinomyces howellii TaxID=52771 RepID=UPI001E48E37E|nr:plasmid mobilization relaxosome protein MobC [Actinomyces howellii]